MKDPHLSRFGPPAQLDLQRYGDNPRSPTAPTAEHLGFGEHSKWSTAIRRGHHDFEEDHIHSHPLKKSVLSKVKETARKFRHSLSGKKKHFEDGNATPSWGVTLDDDEDGEEDAEYLGAPMYESELAPEGYKEYARQHPRAFPVTSEKHVLASSISRDVGQENEKPVVVSPSKTLTETTTEKPVVVSPNKTLTETATEKPVVVSPSKTLTETATEKLAAAYATVSDRSHGIASKLQGLTISNSASTSPSKKQSSDENEKNVSPTLQVWDKGVSMKEYIKQKFEPGDDERALSQVITEAMSPKKSPRGEGSMVEKVKEAVSSFLWNEQEPSQSQSSTAYSAANNSSTTIPSSTNIHEVVEEENHGRILQPN